MSSGAKNEPGKFLEEHIASRKDWGRYVDLTAKVHRAVVAEADVFLSDLKRRIGRALDRRQSDRHG